MRFVKATLYYSFYLQLLDLKFKIVSLQSCRVLCNRVYLLGNKHISSAGRAQLGEFVLSSLKFVGDVFCFLP